MVLRLIHAISVFGSLANGIVYHGARATRSSESQGFDGNGWTPAPTSAPKVPHDLLRRGLLLGRELDSTILVAEDQTCGYLSGSAGAAFTCPNSSTCNMFTAVETKSLGVVACCGDGACNVNLYCINSRQYWSSSACDDLCEADTYTLKCTGSAAPYCNTAVWADVSVKDVYCASRNASATQTLLTNYRGQTYGGTFTTEVLVGTGAGPSTSTTRSISTSTPSSSSISRTPTTIIILGPVTSPPSLPLPADDSNKTPIGPIVGGVIGGVAVLAIIGVGIFIFWRKHRRNQAKHQQPPMYITPDMYGHGSGKPAMQANQQEIYSPRPTPLPMEAYYGQQNMGPAPKQDEPAVQMSSNTSPVIPQAGRESYASVPMNSTALPPNSHEMSGGPLRTE